MLAHNKRFDEAIECLKLCDTEKSRSYLLRCLYNQDKRSVFEEHLNQLMEHEDCNAVVGSFICRAAHKFGTKKPNPFCHDPISYVVSTDLQPLTDFESIFVKPAKDILRADRVSQKKQGLLTNGIQTAGNLFVSEDATMQAIQNIINLEIGKYRDLFEGSEEGLIKNWPDEYSLYGWLVSMKSGGELRAHMHENGWLSGSIYINVPTKKTKGSGNLVVCVDENLEEFLYQFLVHQRKS